MGKIAFVLGTRPEIIKMYSSIQYCIRNNIDHIVVNTDQHYDKNMRDVFFEELGLPRPDYQLGVGSGSHSRMLANMLVAIEEVFLKENPTVVVVQGDTNTVLAGCLVATKMGIKLGHIEAGLRSYDRTMPEEYNRIVTDHCSDFLFAPTQKQADILKQEGIDENSIYVTGNTIVDAVQEVSKRASFEHEGKFALLTCHRPSNTDNEESLEAILSAVQTICEQENIRCVFPAHPRLGAKMDYIKSFDRIEVVEPLGYSKLVAAMRDAEIILTDSGGIQEESCIMQRKCVILRTNTERPETVEVGGAVLLTEVTEDDILSKYQEVKNRTVQWTNPFGDGKAGERIVKTLVEKV
ncbi:MAG: UDP-N-acetylglucosamine 2-epimerase [Candidatus Saccharibacteria bacterium]|nr:UDP-N-acetylglucosamine 2-epimerase [Candidatus Saccharibacteria bacterium]